MNEVRATANIDNVLRRVLRAHAPLLVITSMYVSVCVLLTRIYVYAGIIGAWLIWWIVGLCLRGRLPFSGWRTQDAARPLNLRCCVR